MALDKKINELDEVQSLSNSDLVIIGRPSDGKLFRMTVEDLKNWIKGPVVLQLAAPTLAIAQVNTTSIDVAITGDQRAEKHVLRLAIDAQFNNVIRNATVTAPQNTYQFTGLTPGATYHISLVDTATGFLDSVMVTQSVATSQLAQLAKPAFKVTRTGGNTYKLDWALVANATSAGTYSYEVATDSNFTSIIGTGNEPAPVITANYTIGSANQHLYFRLKVVRNGYVSSEWAYYEVFATTVDFSGSNQQTVGSMTISVNTANATEKLDFDPLSPETGTPISLVLKLGGTTVLLWSLKSGYAGQKARYTATNGTVYPFTIQSGTVNL